jgi:3-methyladenine DNA glycosylase AlkD
MSVVEIVSSRVQELVAAYADSERKSLSDWYYPTEMEVYGIRSANLKIIVSDIKKELKLAGETDPVPVSLKISQLGIFECQLVAYGLLNRNFKAISRLSYSDIMLLGSKMDNWVSTDSFSTRITGPAWRLGVLKDEHIIGWAKSEDQWWRRNALVSTVGLNLKSQGGTGDARRTTMICEMLIDDRNDMVVKAMSWALRELSKREKEPVELFLSTYSDRLASKVKREVTKKLVTGRKNG